jgi:hypothetical protein
MLLVGIIFMMGSMAYAQTAVNCGLKVPLTATPRAANTGHTEPIGAGVPTATGTATPTPANGVDAATGALGFLASPPSEGGGKLTITCHNSGAVGTVNDPGVVALTLNFGVPITNTTTSHPGTNTQIRLANCTGDFLAAGLCTGVGINTTSYSAGQIVIGVGSGAGLGLTPNNGLIFNAATTSSMDVMGTLVSTNGKSGAIVASLTSSGGVNVGPAASGPGANVGGASVNVIDSVQAGLGDPTSPSSLPNLPFFTGVSGGPAVLNSAGTAIKGNFVLRIPEAYADMFRDATQFNGPGTAGNFPNSPSADTQVQVVLNNIPSGLNIGDCAAFLTDAGGTLGTLGSPSVNFTNVTAAAPILTVNFNAVLDLNAIDVLWVKCATVSLGSATVPLPSTPVTAQVTLGPTGAALSGTGGALTALTTGQVPRYQQLLQPTTPITVVLFPPSNTVLLMTFGFVGPGYNTGLAVSNTTVDPFGVSGGGAAASSGTVTFLMVKNDGTSKTYTTTTGSPGSGLTGAGIVASGSTYVVNLSEILDKAGFGTAFTGYVFITANFTHAHGAATIYTTSTGAAALSTPVLVMPAISTAQTRNTPEGLNQ